METTKSPVMMMDDFDVINNDIFLGHTRRPNSEEKRKIDSSKTKPKHQRIKPGKTTISISTPMQTWLSQTPAEEPFNFASWDFEPSREQHGANESDRENHDPDEWSLEVVYGGENGKEDYSSEKMA